MIFKGNGFYLTDYAKKDNKKQKLEKNESKKGNNNESSKNSEQG
jgi:predicted nucleic acid-binding Zn ribbon protein